jgi:hypothetical protein
MADIVERLRTNQPLPICPFDQKSPEYWTTPDNEPCKFCGGLPDGPDKCTGADTRILGEAADLIESIRSRAEKAEAELLTMTRKFNGAVGLKEQQRMRAEYAEATCEKLATAMEPFEKIATAILAEAPADADYLSVFLDCEGVSHRVTMDQLRAVSLAVAYRKEASE